VTTAVELITGFVHVLRAGGIPVDASRTQTAVEAVAAVGFDQRALVREALRASLCSSPIHTEPFDEAFRLYFGGFVPPRSQSIPPVVERPVFTSVPDVPADEGDEAERPSHGEFSVHELLGQRDLARLTDAERAEVRRLIAALRPTGAMRRSRRYRRSRQGPWDGSASIRASFRLAGEVALRHHQHAMRRRKLVILIDVSGSMTGYADAFLRFAHAAVRARPDTEVFTMGTRLTRVTRQLAGRDADAALAAATQIAPDIAGGTRLGDLVAEFLQVWGRRGTARGAEVVICSDGWERGDPRRLSEAVASLALVAHRLIWVNPHEGSPGFEPLTAGLRAVLPLVDVMHSGHTYVALERLGGLLGGAAA
jgi:uncharacterized protein with von Willebrand factor type A (vWA) domain